jgi:hypothetical protein
VNGLWKPSSVPPGVKTTRGEYQAKSGASMHIPQGKRARAELISCVSSHGTRRRPPGASRR